MWLYTTSLLCIQLLCSYQIDTKQNKCVSKSTSSAVNIATADIHKIKLYTRFADAKPLNTNFVSHITKSSQFRWNGNENILDIRKYHEWFAIPIMTNNPRAYYMYTDVMARRNSLITDTLWEKFLSQMDSSPKWLVIRNFYILLLAYTNRWTNSRYFWYIRHHNAIVTSL